MWYYNNVPVLDLIEGFESFVYIIERLNLQEDDVSPKYYIGKKNFYSRRKEKGKKVTFESDWMDYYGSSDQLNLDVERYGKESFKRSILHFCRTKGDSGYLETFEHMTRNVLLMNPDGTRLYYNKNICGRYHSHPTTNQLPLNSKCFKKYYHCEYLDDRIWVNNGKLNKSITSTQVKTVVGKNNWVKGRLAFKECDVSIKTNEIETIDNSSETISIFKDGVYQHIDESMLSEFITKGWNLYDDYEIEEKFYVNNGVSEKCYSDVESAMLHVNEHKYWNEGQLNLRDTSNEVFAIDMSNNEKISVDKELFKSEIMLTKLTAKTIKVKRKNRIIFEGYLAKFHIDYPEIPKNLVNTALKSETGAVVAKGKTAIYEDEKYNFRFT